VILGARTVEQLDDNLGSSELAAALTDDEVARLSDASAPRVDDYPYGTAGVAQRDRKITGGR
jgi:aryl-alcohol dehydrogenase-like predicted oxidoreductase